MWEKLTMKQMQCLSNPSIYSDLPPLGLYPLMFGCFLCFVLWTSLFHGLEDKKM